MSLESPVHKNITRRRLLWTAGAAGLGSGLLPAAGSAEAPVAPVALARCNSYGADLLPVLTKMYDQIGGLGRLVKGKTVAIKINMVGGPGRFGFIPVERTSWTHPAVTAATMHLMARAGARRIRLLEAPWASAEPLEEFMLSAGWEPRKFVSAAQGAQIEFENTNFLGFGKQYVRLPTPKGGHIFKAFDLNHSYADCDVFVSLAKLKEHTTAGITLSMKNCFGITPCTIYGDGAGEQEPSLIPTGGRYPLHTGYRQPSRSSPSESNPTSPREGGYRIPRIVADLVAARPVHLAVIEGIETATGGESAGRNSRAVQPRVLIAGTNCVCVDSVGAAIMGFDPMADRGAAPFELCDNSIRLAEELGVGTRDLKRIEVIGARIPDLVFDYRKLGVPRTIVPQPHDSIRRATPAPS